MPSALSLFRSPEAEAHYVAAYDAVLDLWPVPVQSLSISTDWGSTHILQCGPQDRDPLLLLPGFGAGATMWRPVVGALSRDHSVYAVDTIGDLGKSRLHRSLTGPLDYVDWLAGVISALQITRPAVVGFSQGGWIALYFAAHRPEAISRLALISPNAGLVAVRAQFLLRLLLMIMRPTPAAVDRWARWTSMAWDPGERYFQLLAEQMKAGIAGQSRSRPGALPVTLSDDELAGIRCPVLMLAGAQEVVNDPQAALSRARRHIRQFEGELIPGARHMLPFDQPEQVGDRVLHFPGDHPA